MHIVKIYGQIIDIDTIIEITGLDGIKFKITKINVDNESFNIIWQSGSNKGQSDIIPFSIFGTEVVKVIEVIGDINNPNTAFVRKKHADI